VKPIDIGRVIIGLLNFATFTIFLLFGNFLLQKSTAKVMGIPLPLRQIHFLLGPVLLLANGALFIFLCALSRSDVSHAEITELQRMQSYRFFGAIFNPFYVSGGRFANAIGYAFLIVLWWLGMYSFYYSIGLNASADGPWLFGWQALVSVLYFALGLASMFAIQSCWNKFGPAPYNIKLYVSFLGIAIGAIVPPILLRHGLPFSR
jgi:hypothetical protein